MSGIENGHLVAIAVMGVVTLALRVGGYWLIGRFPLTPRVRRGLEALPIAIFAASIAPLALKGGPAGWIATPVVAVVMLVTGREILALLLGLGVAAGVRALGL